MIWQKFWRRSFQILQQTYATSMRAERRSKRFRNHALPVGCMLSTVSSIISSDILLDITVMEYVLNRPCRSAYAHLVLEGERPAPIALTMYLPASCFSTLSISNLFIGRRNSISLTKADSLSKVGSYI